MLFLSSLFKSIREILLVGHRQAFAWIDEWFGMTLQDVRDFESKMQEETNEKVKSSIFYLSFFLWICLGSSEGISAHHPTTCGK